jgi:hypothetical protein
MTMRILTGALLAAVLPVAAQAASTPSIDPQSAAILQAVRGAMLQRPLSSIASLHLVGSQTTVGIHASYEEWDDLGGLRFATAQTGGPLTGQNGWDGRVVWIGDGTGLVHVDGGASARLQAIDQAYLDTLAFLAPNADGAPVSYGGAKTEATHTYDILQVTPPGGTEFDLWIDRGTHLITKEVGTIGLTTVTVTLSDYRSSHGVTFPFNQAAATSQGNSQTIALTSIDVNQDVGPHLTVPVSHVHDTSIAGGTSTTVPIQVINNHVYLPLLVDGKGPYTFILDTGGALIVTPEVATAVKSSSAGSLQLGGVGNTTEAAGFTHLDSLQIGNATIRNQYSLVLPIGKAFGMSEGVHIDGMIGYEVVARFLTTIDYANSNLTLATLTDAPATAPNASAIPFYFDGTIPNVAIAVDGVQTDAEIDTGSRGSLSLTSPFVTAHPAIGADATTADGVAGFGIGGPAFAKLGRVSALQIGPFTLAHPTVSFGTQTKGAFANPLLSANLGGEVWKRFTVTFDYPHSAVLLAPNATYGRPFTYDRSGLFLIDNNDAYTVLDARAGTPAAQAGLAKGDVILSVDGAPATNQTLAQLRARFMGTAGTVVRLHVKNASGERDVTLTLRDYV